MAANEAEVDLIVNAAGALPDLEQQLSRIVREAENDADAIDLDVAIDTRESVRTLSVQLDQAVRAAEGQLDGIEVGVLIDQREALRTLDRQLSQVVDDTTRRLEVTDPVLIQGVLDSPETIRNVRAQLASVVAAVQQTAPEVEVEVDIDEDAERRLPDLTRELTALGNAARTGARGLAPLTTGVLGLSAAVGGLLPALASLVGVVQQIAPAAAVATQAMLAQKLVAGTLTLAMNGVQEAIERAFDPELSPEEFHKSLKGLAPEARLFVDQLHTMRRELRSIQQGVQNRAFRDLDEALLSLGRTTGPLVTTALNQTASSLNKMAKGAVEAANGLSASGILGQALDGATQGLSNLEQVPGRLLTSFTTLAAGAAPAFDRITQGIDQLTLRIQEKLLRSLDDGSLQSAIDGAVAAFGQLFTIVGNFGEGFGNIFSGLTESGGGLFDVLEKISEAFVKLTASKEFQTILNELVLTFDVLVANVLPLVQEAFNQLAPVIQILAPVVRDFITAIGPELLPVIQELGPVLVDLAKIIQEQLPLAIELTKAALQLLVLALQGLHAVLENVVIPVVKFVADLFDNRYTDALENATDTTAREIPEIGATFGSMGNQVVGVVTLITGKLLEFGRSLKESLVRSAAGAVDDAIDEFVRLGTGITDSLARIPDIAYRIGANIIDGLASGLISGIDRVIGIARGIADSVTSTIKGALQIQSPSKVMKTLGSDTMRGFTIGITSETAALQAALETAAKSVQTALEPKRTLSGVAATSGIANTNRSASRAPVNPLEEEAARLLNRSRSERVVNVYIGNELVGQYVNDRFKSIMNRRDLTFAQGVRI